MLKPVLLCEAGHETLLQIWQCKDGREVCHAWRPEYICVFFLKPLLNNFLTLHSFHHPNSVQERARPCTTLRILALRQPTMSAEPSRYIPPPSHHGQGSAASAQRSTHALAHGKSFTMDGKVKKQYFGYEKHVAPGSPVILWGGYYKKLKKNSTTPADPALIPAKTPSFEFNAFFRECPAGHYVVRWRIKLDENFSIPNGFRFRIGVSYSAEEDTTGSLDVILPQEKLEKGGTYTLELEELVIIQPYQKRCQSGEEQWSTVVITMSSRGSIDDEYSGLQVEYVELSLSSNQNDAAVGTTQYDSIIVKRAATSDFTVDFMESTLPESTLPESTLPVSTVAESTVSGSHPTIPITRIAWSKDNTFLAALALSEDSAYITVWDMKHWNSSRPDDTSTLHQKRAVATIRSQEKGDLRGHSIGLAISPDGFQVAVYQEPMIGQWASGSELDENASQLHLLYPQTVQALTTADGEVVLDMTEPLRDFKNAAQENYIPHSKLKRFIGYGAFFPEARNNDWRMNSSTAHLADKNMGDGSKMDPKNTSNTGTVFVACNGIYMDVFRIRPEPNWEHTHSIRLVDLMPTISRRVTCKMMMETMSGNKFMWLEDGEVCCSIWDLRKGSNVSYISNPNPDNAKLGNPIFRGNRTMSISPDESMAVVATADGGLTTFYANTGVVISNRKFPDHRIEYVAFNGQNSQLFMITRNSVTFELKSWILDPLQLKSEIRMKQVPVPIVDRTIHAFFYKDLENKKFVCEADGSKIHFYATLEPVDKSVPVNDTNLVEPTRTIPESDNVHREEAQETAKEKIEDKLYEVRTATGMKLSRDDDDSMYWILRVEVVESDIDNSEEKVIFSFVPEPWMRVSAADVHHPGDLQKVYFLPGQKRFVVAGIQTLQIWSLPMEGNKDLNLSFIWSRPKVSTDLARLNRNASIDYEKTDEDPATSQRRTVGMTEQERSENTTPSSETPPNSRKPIRRPFETESVGEFYHQIEEAHVYLNQTTGEAEAHIKLMGGFGTDAVRIPRECSINTHSIFLNCARSIHLLAASHTYSIQESMSPKYSEKSLPAFKKHAEAIARFTRGHINRRLPNQYFCPLDIEEEAPEPAMQQQGTNQDMPSQTLPTSHTIQNGGSVTQKDDISCHKLLFLLRPRFCAENHSQQDPSLSVKFFKAVEFVGTSMGKFWTGKDEHTKGDDVFTVLTLLLDEGDLKDTNHVFIEELFKDRRAWIPHPSMAANPLERVVDIKNERLLKVLIDYVVENAREQHPGYLTPAIQCLIKLKEMDSEIVHDLFKRASHIPARNPEYIASRANIINLRFLDMLSFLDQYLTFSIFRGQRFEFAKSSKIEKYKAPVLALRSKLPFRDHTTRASKITDILRRRKTQFPPEKAVEQTGGNRRKIYVSPFQFRRIKGQSRSFLAEFAGEDVFGSPVMEASLWYKWNKSGIYFWLLRFMVVFSYFILVLTITGQQIRVSTPSIDHKPTAKEINDRYLLGWHPAFFLTIAIGGLLIFYEFMQMRFSTWKYFSSPFSYIELAAYLSPVIGCLIFMEARITEYFDGTILKEGGPSQVWILAFGIIAIYANMVSELRIIRPLGIAVNIIINITKKIGWFIFIFALFLISFTHALLYVLHTRRYRACGDEGTAAGNGTAVDTGPAVGNGTAVDKGAADDDCKNSDYPSKYPTNFFEALGTTYFFMSGRYDPVSTSFDKGTVGFRMMMVVFFFFTVIVLLNVLIALMNDAFNKSEIEGEIGYWRMLSEVIAELEMIMSYKEKASDSDNYSEYIYYVKSDEDVKQFQARCATSDVSTLAQSVKLAHDEAHEFQCQILHDVKAVSNAVCSSSQHSCCGGEVKQELDHLKELVEKLVRLQTNNSSSQQ
ncbi:MAG: hypothetical protein J3Q66DRAFT_94295 [Benniella sp.]|nr:MAG: hypothetical protein J3Q66DRAFT_94295 [Benniella sp.]